MKTKTKEFNRKSRLVIGNHRLALAICVALSGALGGTVSTGSAATYLYVDQTDYANSPYTLAATLSYTQIIVGLDSTGEIDQSQYTLTNAGGTNSYNMILGLNANSTGIYKLSGGTLKSSTSEIVGASGAGTFTQTGGANAITGMLVLGNSAGENGSYNLSGTGALSAPNEYLGYSGSATFTQNGGTNTVGTNLEVNYDGGGGSYTLSSGTLTSARTQVSDDVGTGLFTQTGGTHITTTLSLTGYSTTSVGTYNLSGGTLNTGIVTTGDNSVKGTSTFNFNGGTLQASATSTTFMTGLTTANVQSGGAIIDTNGKNITIAQTLVHDTTSGAAAIDGGLTKAATSGTLTLNGSNTFTGPTAINSGTLIAAATAATGMALGGTTQVNINNGATLQFGAANQVNTTAPVVLGSATGSGTAAVNAATYSQGSTATQGLGALTLAATANLNFGSGSTTTTLHFGDSSASAWTSTAVLSILNYSGVVENQNQVPVGVGTNADGLLFGSSGTALTSAQLAEIQFVNPVGADGTVYTGNFGAAIGATGQVFAVVPEPATLLGGVLLIAAAGWHQRRRLLGSGVDKM